MPYKNPLDLIEKEYISSLGADNLGPDSTNDALSFNLLNNYRGANKDLATKRRFHKNFFDLYGGDNEQAIKWLKRNYTQGLDDATEYLIKQGINLDDINKWKE